jgi:stalled ribosome alternative rescue factor ArfA
VKKKPFWKMFRIPLPLKRSRPLSSKKGKKGYDRKQAKKEGTREITESSIEK